MQVFRISWSVIFCVWCIYALSSDPCRAQDADAAALVETDALTQNTPTDLSQSLNSVIRGGITLRPFDYRGQLQLDNDDEALEERNPRYILVLRSHELTGFYDQMTQSLAKLIGYATNGQISISAESGVNSIENIQQSAERSDLFFFTAFARDVDWLREGTADWGPEHPYQQVRSVVSLPPIVLQIVTQGLAQARNLRDLGGARIFAGKSGTNTRRMFDNAYAMLRMPDPINVVPGVVGEDPLIALRRREVDAVAIASPFPDYRITELASVLQLGLVGYPNSDYQNLLESEPQMVTRLIPAYTYENIEFSVETIAEPIGIYTQARMLDMPVRVLTRAYWLWRNALIKGAGQPWWADTDTGDIMHLVAPLHPAALDTYDQAGVILPEAQRP